MFDKLLTIQSLKTSFIFLVVFLCNFFVNAQDTIYKNVNDTLLLQVDSLVVDTLTIDTLEVKKTSAAIKSKVDYSSNDSIRFDVKNQEVFLFNNAEINYDKINLKAAYIKLEFEKSIAFAEGVKDSIGKIVGSPVFTENSQSYKSRTMKYNYETKKGLITKVFTEDGDGYLHGKIIKKMENDEINVKYGSYTTCSNEEHPHYEFRFNKSKVIPGKKIITGPAHLVIEGVSTPLFIPFGLFPNKTGQRSGILIPTYGESADRGFYFEDGGYYWAISDYLDFKLTGDIYTRGSWAVNPYMNYVKRYKFRGSFNMTYAINLVGDKGSSDYKKSNDFAIRWVHSQDPKARPNSRFSANVNIVSNQYNEYNPTSTEVFLSNTFQSSVAYQTNWAGKYFLTVNGSHSQNTKTKKVNITLPEVSFSVNRFYPLRKKAKAGQLKWYENISMNYSMNAKNTINILDSLLFTSEALSQMQNGIKHSVPISSSIKVLKYFNLTNSINITDRMYFKSIRKYWSNDTVWTSDTTYNIGKEKIDTIPGFRNAFDFSLSSSLTTKLYGMVSFKKGPIRAIRHVLTPTVSFSYIPDFGDPVWGYYDYYIDTNGREVDYSVFDGAIYGKPPGQKSGRVNFSLSNNLEIKVRSKKDTITGMKKIVLVDNFSISSSYDLAKDSLNWSKVSMSGRTRLFKNLNITYSSLWDPYILDSTGTKNLNRFEWTENKKFLRLDNTTWNLGLNLNLNSQKLKNQKTSDNGTGEEMSEITETPDQYVDWDVPWKLNISYNVRYSNRNKYVNYERSKEETLVQTLSFWGDISITPKWKIGFRSGYDFETGKLSYTSINIYRDLHCWQMRFNWIPMGVQKSWNFSLNIKSSILQDLKLTKKKDFRDNY